MNSATEANLTPIARLRAIVGAATPEDERSPEWERHWLNLEVATGERCCVGGPQWGHAWNCPTLP